MLKELNLNLYKGDGQTIAERKEKIPEFDASNCYENPANYIASIGLRHAVNVAITLGQPLLVTGEPGTGKTQLAESVRFELGLPKFAFYTKTTSTASDLFYQYDALRRFQDANMGEKKHTNIEDYITYQALGKAILLSLSPEKKDKSVPKDLREGGPTRSVVLIDEIDKAPRDFPNDILNEIENMEFTVKESGQTFKAEKKFHPILILTSNSEKNLPDAFLRRCVFYHIDFPSKQELIDIVNKRFNGRSDFAPEFVSQVIDKFMDIRGLHLKKKPATAEFLNWLKILKAKDIDINNLEAGETEAWMLSFSILAKNIDDLKLMKKKFETTSKN